MEPIHALGSQFIRPSDQEVEEFYQNFGFDVGAPLRRVRALLQRIAQKPRRTGIGQTVPAE